MRSKKGLVHIYTGNGKGKTTAAFGLAVRASGAGMRVSIRQFIKGKAYGEVKALSAIPGITVKQCGAGCFIKNGPSAADRECAENGMRGAAFDILSGKFGLVILDEINITMKLGLVSPEDVIGLIKKKPAKVELVLTGRCCPKKLYRYADYVSDIREVKHPYRRGINAREGIER